MIKEQITHKIKTVRLVLDDLSGTETLLGWEIHIDGKKYPQFYRDFYDTKDEWRAVKTALLENERVMKQKKKEKEGKR